MLLEGKKVFVGPFLKRTERPVDKEQHYTNVFVKNLSENLTDEEVEKMFNEHGMVCNFSCRFREVTAGCDCWKPYRMPACAGVAAKHLTAE